MPHRPDFWPKDKNGAILDVMTISLELHMNKTGSSDCLTPEDRDLYVKSLRHALDNWTLSKEAYDQAVRNVVIETLKEHGFVLQEKLKISDAGQAEIKEMGGDDGFWKSDAENDLVEDVETLLNAGCPEKTAVNVVISAFYTGCHEYGG